MAIRNIIKKGDETLTKKSRPVEVFDERLASIIDDMIETLHAADGVGLAAPQVGILRRICVIGVGKGVIELVNPVIVEQQGAQEVLEGCLSCPGETGVTRRPKIVKVKAQNRRGKWIMFRGEDLKARAFCHEIDHLDGILFEKRVVKDHKISR